MYAVLQNTPKTGIIKCTSHNAVSQLITCVSCLVFARQQAVQKYKNSCFYKSVILTNGAQQKLTDCTAKGRCYNELLIGADYMGALGHKHP